MMQVLFSRKLKLEAALTFWKRHPEDLVSYLFRVHDLCVVADCVGIVTKSFIESDELLSLGACVDLLPLIHALLKSRYENHNLTALEWLTVVIKHWWATLANDDHQNELHFSASNVSTMRDWLQKMMDQVRKLLVIPGPTGKGAKVSP
uniref:Katanin p80 subunit C-terminal domain-containing protein n=1 Tax=Eptatretus burgeri TaxID=7764 RepID=A0A8C4R9H7_EPTBU